MFNATVLVTNASSGPLPSRKKMTLRKNVKQLKLDCGHSKSKSRQAKLKNRKKKLGRKLLRKKPRRKRLNLLPNEPSLKQPESENDNSSCSSNRSRMTRRQTRMKALNISRHRKALQQQARCSQARLPRRHRVMLLRSLRQAVVMSQPLFRVHLLKSREIHISENCHKVSKQRMANQSSHHRRSHRQAHLHHRRRAIICHQPTRSTAWLNRRPSHSLPHSQQPSPDAAPKKTNGRLLAPTRKTRVTRKKTEQAEDLPNI